MTEVARRSRDLTAAEVDDVLTLLVRLGGNTNRTSRVLAERGIEVPQQTLSDWKRTTHQERYLDIASAFAKESKDAAVIQGFRELLQESQDLSSELRQRLWANLDDVKPEEIPKLVQQLSVSMGIATQNALLLEGRPTEIRETRNPDWYEAKLRELAEDLTVDSTAVEENVEDVEESPSESEEPAGPATK